MRSLRSIIRAGILTALTLGAVAALHLLTADLAPQLGALVSLLSLGAVVSGGILGKARNKIGDVVFSSWKGIQTARLRVTPANPRTVKQQAARSTFGQISQSLRFWLDLTARPLVDPIVAKQSGYNRLTQLSRLGMGDAYDAMALTVSDGPIPAPDVVAGDFANGEDTITFPVAASGDEAGADMIYAQAADAATGALVGPLLSTPRATGTLATGEAAGIESGKSVLYVWATGSRNGGPVLGSLSVAVGVELNEREVSTIRGGRRNDGRVNE